MMARATIKWGLVLAVFVMSAGAAGAAPPSTPQFMPGFPLIAGNLVMVMWTPVPGATSYNLYMNGKVVGKGLAMPPYQFPTPEAAGDYELEMTALGPDGSESGKSPGRKISIVKLLPPKDIATLVGEKNIGFRWTNQPGAIVTDVYRSEKVNGDYILIGSFQDARFSDGKVETGKVYHYKFRSKDISGKESDFSPVITLSLAKAAVSENKVAQLKLKKSKVTLIAPSVPFVPNDLIVEGEEIFVLDRSGQGIKVYGLDGKFLRKIGNNGYLPGQFIYPSGFHRLSNRNFVISDNSRKVIMILTPEGELVKEWKFPVPAGAAEARPNKLSVNSKDEIVVVDDTNTFLVKFSAKGELLGRFGGKYGDKNVGPEFFVGIGSIDFDSRDNLYAADWKAGNVHVLDPNMKHRTTIGYPAGVGALIQPGKVVFDEKNGNILVPDSLPATVQAFRLKDGTYMYTLTNEKGEMHENKQKGVWEVADPVFLAPGPKGDIYGINSIDRVFFRIEIVE